MTVSFDASSEFEGIATLNDPTTWTHTPVGTPRGAALSFVHGVSISDHIVGVTYGGVALSRVVRITHSGDELGAAEWWFVGAGLTGGPKTVSVDLTGPVTDNSHLVMVTLGGAADLEVIDFDSLAGELTNPSLVLQYGGKTALTLGAIFSGKGSPDLLTELAGCTRLQDLDLVANSSIASRQSTPGSSNFTMGWTASVEDVAFVAMAISEIASGTPPRRSRIVRPGEAVHRASRW